MELKTKYGRPRCVGRKLNGLQCREPKDTPSEYCHYCDQLVRGLTTPMTPGFNPTKGQINGYDWTAAGKLSSQLRRIRLEAK